MMLFIPPPLVLLGDAAAFRDGETLTEVKTGTPPRCTLHAQTHIILNSSSFISIFLSICCQLHHQNASPPSPPPPSRLNAPAPLDGGGAAPPQGRECG